MQYSCSWTKTPKAYFLHSGYCWPCPNDGSALPNRVMLMMVHIATSLTSGTSFIGSLCCCPTMVRLGMADSLTLVSRENEGIGKEDSVAHKWPSRTNSKFYRLTIVSKVEILKSLSSTTGSIQDPRNTQGKNFHKHKLSWISLLQLAKWVPVEAVEYLAHIA